MTPLIRPAIMVILGTKAQYIKTAPVLKELDAEGVPYRLIYTGQHSETFDVLEKAFGTRQPDEVLVPSFEAATKISFLRWTIKFWISVVRHIFRKSWKGVRVGLVHGDTASTLFGALMLRMIGAQVAHVEAGLRSPQLMNPFPEEIVRRLVSKLSSFHFVPDEAAERNLRRTSGLVVNTQGNTLRDSLILALGSASMQLNEGGSGGFAVVSCHRNENLSNEQDFDLLMKVVCDTAEVLPLKFVLHPATREKLKRSHWMERLERSKNIELVERMDYPEFVQLLLKARFLLTDGGSNQEEAAMLGLPALLLRRTTERGDGIGENVILSKLNESVVKSFVSKYAKVNWEIKPISQSSPSKALVSSLMGHAN